MAGQNMLSRLHESHNESAVSSEIPNPNHGSNKLWSQEKNRLQNEFLDQYDVSAFKSTDADEFEVRLRSDIYEFVTKNLISEFSEAAERMVEEVQKNFVKLGPLEPLSQDMSISEIMVNGTESVYIEKNGRIHETMIRFQNEKHIRIIIEQIVATIGRHIDEKRPMVDARLPDGSRVNVIIPPAAPCGSTITIRRFLHNKLNTKDLVTLGTATNDMLSFINSAVQGSLNIVISGRTGSGKTTFLNLISSFIPHEERIVTIEDAAEISLQQKHVITLESVPSDRYGRNEVTIRDLVKNSLRMRPDRIIVGECRGDEAFDMLQAMNTGHDGSMTTIHANSPRDALNRIGSLFVMAGYDIPEHVIRQHMASAIDLVIQIDRLPDGSRKVTHITEITGMEGDVITMQDIYELDWKMDETGKLAACHRCTGIRPKCARKLEDHGLPLPEFTQSSVELVSQKTHISSHQFNFGDQALLKTR